MSIVVIDQKGRVYLPSDVRRKLGISKGSRMRLIIEDDKIILVPVREKRLLKANRKWGPEAFLDAGEALVSQ